MNAVTAWTIIVCATLVCITAVTIVGLVVGNRKPKHDVEAVPEAFRVRDMPMPVKQPAPVRMKNRKLE